MKEYAFAQNQCFAMVEGSAANEEEECQQDEKTHKVADRKTILEFFTQLRQYNSFPDIPILLLLALKGLA